tara:strand:+ start:17956 stop:19221 length:1266 start_codon:yes stop_codon:yes gene_type:complete
MDSLIKHNGTQIALTIDKKDYTYGELVSAVESQNIDSQIHFLTATKSFKFIVEFLARLEHDAPSVIMADYWPEEETQTKKDLVGKNTLHDQCSLVMFTSGSSGAPKGVQLSKQNISHCTQAILKALEFKNVKNQLLFLPLSYSYGLLGQLLPGLLAGQHIHILPSVVHAKFFIDEHNVQLMLSGVPSHLQTLCELYPPDHQIPHIKSIVSAGGELRLDLRIRLREVFPNAKIFNNYGQTEMSPRALVMNSDAKEFFSLKTGEPIAGMQAQLTEQGEICFRGPHIMLGYIGQELKLDKGWYHTGDLAEKDSQGIYTIKGRQDHLVKVSGERVSLKEIEDVIGSIDEVERAIVCLRSEDNKLLVFLKLNQTLTKKEMIHYLKPRLSQTKIPQLYYKVEKFPLNPNGKIDRNQLINSLDSYRLL